VKANIGGVVRGATDVAKETADLVLLDDNFRTVVAAVEEGRVIFENIRKVVAYTLSNSFAEDVTIFGALIAGWPAPLTVAQILWIHLICDGPSDIVLGFEPKEEGIMEESPKPLSEPIRNRLGLSLIGIISLASAALALTFFGHYYLMHRNPIEGRSFAVNSMIYILGYRSLRRSILHSGPLTQNKPLIAAIAGGLLLAVGAFVVPPVRELLGIVPLTVQQWAVVVGVAISMIGVVEVVKPINNYRHRSLSVRGKPAERVP
jgi:Ca2+-transporting ATPase